MSLRRTFFWCHFVAGVGAGVVIAIMSFTGAILAFEKEIVGWVENARESSVRPSPDAQRRPLDEILKELKATEPRAEPSAVTVYREAERPILVAQGRTNVWYLNPFTGEVQSRGCLQLRSFLALMLEAHRWLVLSGDQRNVGKAITGGANVAFFFLGLSGVYLWWPSRWSPAALRAILLFRRGLSGRARDWNWHNVIGFWSSLVLLVLTATAFPISYRWAGNLLYRITGSEPPTESRPGGARGGPAVEVNAPAEGSKPLPLESILVAAGVEIPDWAEMTVRLGSAGRATEGTSRQAGANSVKGGEGRRNASASNESVAKDPGSNRGPSFERAARAWQISVKEKDAWPRFASIQVAMDPYRGTVLTRESFADAAPGRRLRTWSRFLHTGEALGWIGQSVAAVACLGALVLTWTGFALAWRRVFRRRAAAPAVASEASTSSTTPLAPSQTTRSQ